MIHEVTAQGLRYAAHEADGARHRANDLRKYLASLDPFEGKSEIDDRLKRATNDLEWAQLMLDSRALSLEVEPNGGAVVAA